MSETSPARRVNDKRADSEVDWNDAPQFNALGIAETWSVIVEAEGQRVLCIGDESVSGLDGDKFDQFKETVRNCAMHLLGFIGAGPIQASPASGSVDLDKLEAIRQAATPGPWVWWTSNSYMRLSARGDGDVAYGHRLHDGVCTITISKENAEFIQTFNPALVSRLIALARSNTPAASGDKQPLAWARRWHVDGEKPAKEKNAGGRWAWPQKFKFHAVTPHKVFKDDVPLYMGAASTASVAALQGLTDQVKLQRRIIEAQAHEIASLKTAALHGGAAGSASPAAADENETQDEQAQREFMHATQVFFRAGLLACREYMARFVEAESTSIAASIRANWWPSLGKDFGPPRKLNWEELTEGEFDTPSFRVKTTDEVSPTQEALPIALGFLVSIGSPESAAAQSVSDAGGAGNE